AGYALYGFERGELAGELPHAVSGGGRDPGGAFDPPLDHGHLEALAHGPLSEPGRGRTRGSGGGPGRKPLMSNSTANLQGPNVAGLLPESAVSALVDHAAKMPASDLFFSHNENHVAVAVRHLGIVRLLTILTPEQGRRCTSYIKAIAGMDLAEQRRPLD